MSPLRPRAPYPASVESPYGWLVAFVSLALVALGTGAVFVVMIGLKPIAADMGWPRQVPGLAYGLAMTGMGLGGIWLGRWSDRVGAAWPALCGVLMIAAGAWLAGHSSGRWAFLAAHGVLIGLLGNGALFVPLLAGITRWFDRRLGIAVAVVISGQSLGGAMWPPVLRYLLEELGWRQTYQVVALALLAAMTPLILVLRREPPGGRAPARRRTAGADSGQVLGLPGALVLALLCAAIVGCCVAMAMPMVHLVAHASDLGHPTARAAELVSLLLACSVVSRLGWGWVSDRVGGLRTLLAGSTGQAVMLSMFVVTEGLTELYVVAALFGLAFGGVVPSYAMIVHQIFPREEVGRRIGPVVFFGTVGMALGGWLGGFVFDLYGDYQRAFAVGVAFNLGNLALVGLLFRQYLRVGAGAPGGAR